MIAFGSAMIDLFVERRDLMAEVQAGPALAADGHLSGTGPTLPTSGAGRARAGAEFVADALLGVLRADPVNHLVVDRGVDVARLKDGFRALATSLLS